MTDGLDIATVHETRCREWVQQQAASGLKAPAFCQQHGLNRSTFYGWRLKLAQRDRQRAGGPAFVPVNVSESISTACLEILLGRGHRIQLTGPVDRQMLRDVVAVLEERPC